MSLARHVTPIARFLYNPPLSVVRLHVPHKPQFLGPRGLSTCSTVSSSDHDRAMVFSPALRSNPSRQLSTVFVFNSSPYHSYGARGFCTTLHLQADPEKPKRENAGQEAAQSVAEPPPSVDILANPNASLFQRFKAMAKQYWYVLVPVHIVTTFFWVGGFYLLAKSGLDLESILDRLGAPEVLMKPVRNSNAGYYAVTYACYKLATPFRYVVTIGGTTVVVRYLTRYGYLKPMPNKKQLTKMYHEGIDNFANRQKAWRKRLDDVNWRLKVKERLKGKRKS